MEAPILVRPNFKEPFCLDVDWSTNGVGAILSQREGRFEKVVAYANKALTVAQKKFHPMEGECYALIWGILHFRQYLHRTHFTLRMDHKPLEWLATVSNAHGRRGRWIDLLQDYSFKIVHRPGMRHANVDALSRNPVGQALDDEDFHQEIQDDPHMQHGVPEADEKVLAVWYGQHVGLHRSKGLMWGRSVHIRDDDGIKQWRSSDLHHLFMIDLVTTAESSEEEDPDAVQTNVRGDEDQEFDRGRQRPGKEQVRYYNRRQQLELVLAAQELSEVGGREVDLTAVVVEDKGGGEMKGTDIWQDANCLALLKEGVLPEMIEPEEGRRARKRVANYCWKEQKLFFKDLYVPKPEERRSLVLQMHEDLGHSGEERLLTEICRRYFWHCRTEDVKSVVKGCQQC
jgi:hypothetical protein